MNTYLPKILKFISANDMEPVPVVKRWHFYGYFLLALIFYSIVYSVYGDTGTNTAVQFPVAQPAPPTPIVVPDLNGLINVFQDAGTGWQKTLIVVATNLFYLLAAIEIAWTSIRLTLRQADLGDWTSEMVYQIMFIGFFYMLLINSVEWSNDIIQSFRMAGQAASLEGGGTNGVSPTIIFNIGYNMASKLLATVTFVREGDAFFLVLSAFIILICSTLIAAFMILVLIETYFAIYAGIIFMGFGGSRFTSQIAVKTLQYTLAAGGKLFFVQLLGGLIEKQMVLVQQEFLTFTTIHNTVIFKIIGIFIICVIIVKRAPEILQSMLNGINFNFTFLPPVSDTSNAVAPAPVNSTTTISNLTSAAAPSGYTPPLTGVFNTAAQNIPAESIGNRLLDVANTTFHTAAFSESGSISTDASSFGAFATPVPAAPSSQANAAVATPNMPNAATNVDTGASSTRAVDTPSPTTTPSAAAASVATPQTASPSSAATSQVDNQNTRDAGNAAANQTAAGSAAAANATANRPDTAAANNMGSTPADGYQSAGLGGRFGVAGSGAGPNTGANAPDQANQLSQPGQGGQSNQDVASSTSPLNGQQKMAAAADTDMPKDSNQGGQNVSSSTSALGGQQNQPQPSQQMGPQAQQIGTQAGEQANGADATKNNTGNTSAGNTTAAATETLKSPSEANDKAASNAAQSTSASGSVNQPSAASNPNAAATTAPTASTVATPAPGSATASSTPTSASTAPGSAAASSTPASASTAPGSAAVSSTPASASTAPGSAAAASTPTSVSTAPGSAAAASTPTSASTAPGSAAASSIPVSAPATPATAAAPATPSGNSPSAQKMPSTSEAHKNPAGRSAPSPVDDKNKAADKNADKNQGDDKSKKLKDILEDKKNKPDDPDLDDDSFDDKPKKPKYPKGDHHDEK